MLKDYSLPLSLSDEAAVEILEFLHALCEEFEVRYGAQIRRYYDDRAQHNRTHPFVMVTDPPF